MNRIKLSIVFFVLTVHLEATLATNHLYHNGERNLFAGENVASSEENPEEEWIEVTEGFDKSIPFTKIRVLNKKSSSDLYCCVFFSTKPNDNTKQDTRYSINFYTLNIGDDQIQNTGKSLFLCKNVGDGWYEYEFKQPVYFSHYQQNASRRSLKVCVMHIPSIPEQAQTSASEPVHEAESSVVITKPYEEVDPRTHTQNPVKKVKYMKHVYEGEIGKKKTPEGLGLMFFEGFNVWGNFQGNEVSNATLSVDGLDVKYYGSLSFDESQNVVLKNGIIKTIVYIEQGQGGTPEMGIQSFSWGASGTGKWTSDWNVGLQGIPYTIETISTDKTVSRLDLDAADIYIPDTIYISWSEGLQKLNPPTIQKPIQHKAVSIPITYKGENALPDGGNEIKLWHEGIVSFSAGQPNANERDELYRNLENRGLQRYFRGDEPFKAKVIHILPYRPAEQLKVSEYKDEKGRVWISDGYNVSVTYPNGSFIDNKTCKLIFSNGMVVKLGSDHHGICNFYNSNNEVIAACFCQMDNLFDLFQLAETHEFKIDESSTFLKLASQPCIWVYRGSTTPSDSEVENLLNHKIFPSFARKEDGSMESVRYEEEPAEYTSESGVKNSFAGKYIPITVGDYDATSYDLKNQHGRYYPDKGVFYSEERIKELVKRDWKPLYDRLLANISSYTKRFGFDPSKRKLRDLVKSGQSFRLLQDYFRFTEKWNKTELPAFLFKNYSFWDTRNNRREVFLRPYFEEYYAFGNARIDLGSKKCYNLYLKTTYSTYREGYVWVSGDRIISVYWY